jgi:hypothetical protein
LELLKKRIQELEIENHIKDSFNKGYLERIGELETALLEQKDNEIDSYKGILNGIKELLK